MARYRKSPGRARSIAAAVSAAVTVAGATPGLADDAVLKEARQIVEQGYAGIYDAPPGSGPAAVQGKTIWYVSCGQAFVLCARQAEGFREAGEHLGWNVVIQDGRASPAAATDIIRQGIAARVDGIAISAFDCPGIKSALLQARSEDVPVVGMQSVDCSAEEFGGEEALFTASVNLMGSTDATDFYERFGEMRANYIIAKSGGAAEILSIAETSQRVMQANHEGFMNRIAACTECSVTVSEFNFGQVPSPATQIWQSALLQNPDATVLEYGIDALMQLGLQTAVRQSGRQDLMVGGGEGFPANFDLIRAGTQTFSVGLPFTWFGWAVADTMNRVMAGDDPESFPSQGTGFRYVDADHNLPPEGEMLEPSVDFRSAYLSIWNG